MEQKKYTERQLNVLTILSNQSFSQKNLTDIYEGALIALKNTENPESIYQAAHSLRELIDYTTAHIKSLGNIDRKNQIRIFIEDFDPLGGLNLEAVFDQWVDFYNYFAPLSHHHDSISPPELFEEKQYLLENVILAIHGPISVPITELDKLIEKQNPTTNDLEIVLSLIKNFSSYDYFFKHLQNPSWLDLLEEKSVYKNIPKFGERSVESLFLLKIVEQKPNLVLEIIKRHSETDHSVVRVNYIKCLSKMSSDSIIQMINPLIKWINSQINYNPSFYLALVEIVKKLITDNKEFELFDLLNRMYSIKSEILKNDEILRSKLDEQFEKRRKNEEIEQYGVNVLYQEDLGGEFLEESECYMYETIVKKNLSELLQKYPIKTLSLFLKNLDFSIQFFLKNSNSKDSFDDHSLIWIKKLTEKTLSKTFRSFLIEIVLEIILYIGNNAEERFPELISELRKCNKLLFRRLEYFSYSQFPELSIDYIDTIKLNTELYNKIDENFELYTLFNTSFEQFPKNTRDSFLKFVSKSLKKQNKKALKRSNKIRNLPKLKKDDIIRIIKHDQIKKLKPISKYVESDLLEKLEIDSSEIDKVTLFKENLVFFGTKSPLSESMIENSTMEELKVHLLKYDEEKSFDFDKIGLGRQLKKNISKRPDEFIILLNDLLILPKLHKYISFIIDGLNSAFKGNREVDLKSLVEIFKTLLSDDFIIDPEPLFFKENTSRDIKKEIADFIHENLTVKTIPIDFKQIVWELILMLLRVEDIDREKEIERIQRNWMPRDMSLNTVKGIATNSIFAYISWFLESDPEKYASIRNNDKKLSDFIPESLEVIENLLNEDLYTTRYIIGTNFYYLCFLEFDWVKARIFLIFSNEIEHLDYFEAAWSGFLDYSGITVKYFEFVRPSYLYALSLVNDDFKLIPFSKIRFINHILTLYLEDIEKLDSEHSLISIFFNSASDENRKIAIRNIGSRLEDYQGTRDFEEVKESLIFLMEYRLKEANTNDITNYIEELHGFIFWFRNSIFEEEWTINKLLEIVSLLDDFFKGTYFIHKILKDYARIYPDQVMGCLEIIIKKELEKEYIVFEHEYKTILKHVLNSESDDSKQRAVKLINELLRMNFHNFRDLLIE